MTQLGKFEKYLIEEFFDDYRAGAMTPTHLHPPGGVHHGQHGRGVGRDAAGGLHAGGSPAQHRSHAHAGTPSSSAGTGTASAGPVPGAKSPLSVPEGAPGLTTATVRFPAGGTDISAYLARPESGAAGPAVLVCHENRGLTPHIQDVARRFAKAGYAALALDLLSREGGTASHGPRRRPRSADQRPAPNAMSPTSPRLSTTCSPRTSWTADGSP